MELLRKITATFIIALIYLKLIVARIFDYEGPEVIFIDILLYLLCFAMIDIRKVEPKILLVVLFLVIAVVSPPARTFALLVLLLYALKDCDLYYIAKVNVICSILLFGYMALAIQGGALIDKSLLTTDGETLRYDFGFGNPNLLALVTFGMLSNIYFLMAKNHKWLTVVILTAVTTLVTWHSGSRTFAAVMIFIITYMIFQKCTSVKSNTHKFIRMLPLLIAGATIAAAFAVRLLPIIDLFFSGRLSLYSSLVGQTSIVQYIIGNPMIDEITIDSSYMQMLFRAGIGGGILFYCLYNNAIKNLAENYHYLLPLFVGMVLYATTESYLVNWIIFSNMILWIFIFQNGFTEHRTNIDK